MTATSGATAISELRVPLPKPRNTGQTATIEQNTALQHRTPAVEEDQDRERTNARNEVLQVAALLRGSPHTARAISPPQVSRMPRIPKRDDSRRPE